MKVRLRAVLSLPLILLLAGSVRLADAADLKNAIRNLYGGQGILLEPLPLPFPSQESRFQASSLQGLDQLNSQLTSAIGVPSFNSSVTGFTFDIERGVPVRTTESLGTLLTERATTLGARKFDLTFTYTRVNFTKLQGKDLKDLELIFLRGDANGNGILDTSGPFSFESDVIRAKLSVDLTEDIFALIATYGLTSEWDVGFVVPVTHIRLIAKAHAAIFDQFGNPGGTKFGDIPIHRFGPNSSQPDASGGGDETGLGDIILRTKYNFLRHYDDLIPDMAFLVELKLPTGNEERLLGTGGTNVTGLLVASRTYAQWFTPHVNLGYEIDTKDTRQNTVRYALGFDARLLPELTLAAGLIGRAKPDGSGTGDHIVDLSLGVKWNPVKSLILRTNVQIPLDKNSGLRADFIPTVGIEYIF
ncbi:MAG: transporter [candidate division NC10 bacterium]|nr:transporter [candidate division NC10 bacterium]